MPNLSSIGSLEIGAETTFGTLASNFDYFRCMLDRSGLVRDVIVDEHQRQGDYEVARILGARNGSVVVRIPLFGFASAIPSAAPTLTSAEDAGAGAWDLFMAILASALGNVHAGGYVGSETVGYSGSPPTLTAGDLTSFDVGEAIAWATANSPAYELGWIKDNTAGTPDSAPLLQLPRANPQGTTLWGAYNVFVRDGEPYHAGNVKSFSLRFKGHGSDDLVRMYGCMPTNVKFIGERAKPTMVEITFGVAHWEDVGSGGTPSVQAWSYPAALPASSWRFAIGSSSVSSPAIRSWELDLGLTRPALEGGNSLSGIEAWHAVTRKPRLTTQFLRTHALEITDFDAQTGKPVTIQYGTQPGKLFGLCMPNARLVEYPSPADRDGLMVSNLVFEPHYYAGDTGSDMTLPLNTILKLAFA